LFVGRLLVAPLARTLMRCRTFYLLDAYRQGTAKIHRCVRRLTPRKFCIKFLDAYFPRPLRRRLLVLIVSLEALMIARMVIGLILFCLTLSNANAASILLRTYKSPIDKADKALLKVYLDGVKEGIVMLNVTLQAEGRQPLFCQPQKLALTVERAEEIMMRKAKKMADPDRIPVSIILIHGLQDTFPCDEKH
jgi:hypothetical protein